MVFPNLITFSLHPYPCMNTFLSYETFEKCSILFKVKSKIPDFERGKPRILTTGIP
jgi:hypothetical protein